MSEEDGAAGAAVELPYQVDGVSPVAGVRRGMESLPPGSSTGVRAKVAGRLMLLRRQGKLAFGDLVDSSGRIQVMLSARTTEGFDRFVHERVIGDWLAVEGEVITTKSGELSILADRWELLAPAQRSFGDKWKGISDPDLRFRQRYVDLWVNPEVRQRLQARSVIVSRIRSVLAERDFMEVETPILQPIASGAAARPFVTHHNALDMDLYLRIAPELYLKRLVVGGFERVFEIGRDFRNEGISPRHNPEFTMLELYQAYTDMYGMMELVELLVAEAALAATGSTTVSYQGEAFDLTPPFERHSMEFLISKALGEEVSLEMGVERLAAVARGAGLDPAPHLESGHIVMELYEALVEPQLRSPIFVTDFPQVVSPLARRHRDPAMSGRAERFELVIGGRELANAFSELTDPVVQRQHFEEQAAEREHGNVEAMAFDRDYVRALEYGLPPTGGMGVDIDRLVMLVTDAAHIKEVIAFPTLRPEQR